MIVTIPGETIRLSFGTGRERAALNPRYVHMTRFDLSIVMCNCGEPCLCELIRVVNSCVENKKGQEKDSI